MSGRKSNGYFDIGNKIQMLGTHNNLYKPEYCDLIIDHMTQGFSYESFAGVVGVSKQTLYNWESNNPEFKEAKEVGKSRSLLWWEGIMLEHIVHTQRGKRVDPNNWKYNMTVRFGWREETVQHQHQTITEVTITEKKREE